MARDTAIRILIGLTAVVTLTAASAADIAGAARTATGGQVLVLQGRTELPGYTGDFDHLMADPASNRLFLAAEDHGTVEVFDLKTGKHLRTVKGFENPHSFLMIPSRHQILVTDGSATVKLLNDRTLAHVGEIKLHPGADSIGYDEASGHLYIVTGGKDVKLQESWLEEIVPHTGKQIGSLQFDANHVEALAVEQQGPNIYINITDKNELDVVDKRRLAVTARWPIREAEQNAMAQLDPRTRRLFVVTRKPGKMLVLDAGSGATLASFEAPGHADAEIFDAGNRRVYVPGGDGWIGVYQENDADHFAELARVTSAEGAKTAVLVPELHRLYVAVSPGERHSGGGVLWFDVKPARR